MCGGGVVLHEPGEAPTNSIPPPLPSFLRSLAPPALHVTSADDENKREAFVKEEKLRMGQQAVQMEFATHSLSSEAETEAEAEAEAEAAAGKYM